MFTVPGSMFAFANFEITTGMPPESQSRDPAFLAIKHSSVSARRLSLILVTSLVRMLVGGDLSDAILFAAVNALSGGRVPVVACSDAITVTPARRSASMNNARAYAAGVGANWARAC